MVPGLADGSAGYVSFESVNHPGHYLRHSFFEMVLARDDGTALFDKDATFKMTEGLADEWCTSFQSYNFPAQHLRHSGFELQLDPIEDAGDRADATFCITV
jgi:hypothetical protein